MRSCQGKVGTAQGNPILVHANSGPRGPLQRPYLVEMANARLVQVTHIQQHSFLRAALFRLVKEVMKELWGDVGRSGLFQLLGV